MGKYSLDLKEYARLAREVAAESCVLLKNDNNTLPLKKGDKVAVFGRSAFNYYKSGLGSGGLVNTRYVVSILDALRNEKDIVLDEDLLEIYSEWIKENPYDEGHGWGTVPWSQKEMKLEDLDEEAIDNSTKLGAYIYHFFWDNNVIGGMETPYVGGLRGEILHPKNVIVSNAREKDIQKQKYIIILLEKLIYDIDNSTRQTLKSE